MAVIVTGPLNKPVVTPTLQAGGSLAANTTYYVRVLAGDGGASLNQNVYRTKLSDEISFTTDAINKSVKLDWTAPTGADYYWVYLSTTSGSYYGKSQTNYYSGQSATTLTITATADKTHSSNYYSQLWFWEDINIPGGLDKEAGRISVSFTGTTTLQDIYDAIIAAGYTGNVFYDGDVFILFGNIYLSGSTITSLTERSKVIVFCEGTFINTNPNAIITFGQYDSTNQVGYDGCILYSATDYYLLNTWIAGTFNFYGGTISGHYSKGLKGDYSYSYPTIAGYTSGKVNLVGVVIADFVYANLVGTTLTDITAINVQEGMNPSTASAICTRLTSLKGTMCPGNNAQTFYDCIIKNGTGTGYYGSDIRLSYTSPNQPKYYNLSVPKRTGNIPVLFGSQNTIADFYFTLDLTIQDLNGNKLSGVTVVIKDITNTPVDGSPFITDVNGNINTYLYANQQSRAAAGIGQYDTITFYTPHTVTISKSGYITKVIKYTMDRKREDVETLEVVLVPSAPYPHKLIFTTIIK